MTTTDDALAAIRSLDYLILPCRDLPAMRRFYQSTLGFPLYRDRFGGNWVELRVGATLLTLRPRDLLAFGGVSADAAAPARGASVQLAFRVPTAEVDACHRALRAAGVPVLDPPTDQAWGHRTLFVTDPDDNLVELYADL